MELATAAGGMQGQEGSGDSAGDDGSSVMRAAMGHGDGTVVVTENAIDC